MQVSLNVLLFQGYGNLAKSRWLKTIGCHEQYLSMINLLFVKANIPLNRSQLSIKLGSLKPQRIRQQHVTDSLSAHVHADGASLGKGQRTLSLSGNEERQRGTEVEAEWRVVIHGSLAYSHLEDSVWVGERLSRKNQLQFFVPTSSFNVGDQ